MNPHVLDCKEAPTSMHPPLTFTQGLLGWCLARGDIQTGSEEASGDQFLLPAAWGRPAHFRSPVKAPRRSLGEGPGAVRPVCRLQAGMGPGQAWGPAQPGALWVGGGGGSEGRGGRGGQAQAEKLEACRAAGPHG